MDSVQMGPIHVVRAVLALPEACEGCRTMISGGAKAVVLRGAEFRARLCEDCEEERLRFALMMARG